jgi:hypothetical protein
MEEIINFNKWLDSQILAEPKYVAAYDPITGSVLAIGSETALAGETTKVLVDEEIALQVLDGSIPIHRCYVELETATVKIAEIKSILKVNDVLHRIIESQYSLVDEHDIIVTYEKKSKIFTIKSNGLEKKSVHWSVDTKLPFYLTDYNDPNIVYKIVDIIISDIIDSSVTIEKIELPERFSVYTKRIFRNYILEVI